MAGGIGGEVGMVALLSVKLVKDGRTASVVTTKKRYKDIPRTLPLLCTHMRRKGDRFGSRTCEAGSD